MKTIYFIAAVSSTSVSFGQTTVFEKNKEAALVSSNQHLSKMIITEFLVEAGVSPDQYLEMITVMEAKDGYVSCTLQGKKIILSHEDWVMLDDIIDVITVAGMNAKPLVRENRD